MKEYEGFSGHLFCKGLPKGIICRRQNEEQAEKMVSKDFNIEDHYELNRIKECELFAENIIHTEVIEVV